MAITAKGLQKLGFVVLVDFVLQDDGDGVYIKEWNSNQSPPTEDEIESADAEWQAEYESQEYARLRKAEYPSIEECVHAILDDDLDALQAKRAEVKARFPK
jgi:hypothetical protein